MLQPNFCAVVGSQRSGTTLTAQILGAHSKSIVIDEDDGLYTWTSALIERTGSSEDLLSTAVRNAQNKYAEPERRFSSLGLLPEIQTIVLKAPNLTYSWSELATVLPGAKIIYVYRSVKAIVASMKKLRSVPIVENQTRYLLANEITARRFASEIKLLGSKSEPVCNKMALVALIKMSFAADFREAGFAVEAVQYEDLVHDPEREVSRLLKYLDLDYEDQCVNYHKQYQGVGPGLTVRTRKVDEKSVAAWAHVLSTEEQDSVDAVIVDFIHQHGHMFELCDID